MGFPVPEAALNVTLQEDKYHHYIMDLDIMLRNYNQVINSLSPVEKELLKDKLEEVSVLSLLSTSKPFLNSSLRFRSLADAKDTQNWLHPAQLELSEDPSLHRGLQQGGREVQVGSFGDSEERRHDRGGCYGHPELGSRPEGGLHGRYGVRTDKGLKSNSYN